MVEYNQLPAGIISFKRPTESLNDSLNNFNYSAIQQQIPQQSIGSEISLNGLDYSKNAALNWNMPNAPTETTGTGNWFSKLSSHKDPITGEKTPDYLGAGLGLLKSGLGFYLGSQQLGQAEDTLAENKRQFNTNYAAQKTLINDQLNWQYQARKDRNAANAGELAQIA